MFPTSMKVFRISGRDRKLALAASDLFTPQ